VGALRWAATVARLWSGFGLAALAGHAAVHTLVDRWPCLDAHSGLILAATLGLASAF